MLSQNAILNTQLGIFMEPKQNIVLTRQKGKFLLKTELSIPKISIQDSCHMNNDLILSLAERLGLLSTEVKLSESIDYARLLKIILSELEIRNQDLVRDIGFRFIKYDSYSENKSKRKRRSVIKYWRNGGVFNLFTGHYTDIKTDEVRKEVDTLNEKVTYGMKYTESEIFGLKLKMADLENRLNKEICEIHGQLMKDVLPFEITMMTNILELKYETALNTCFEGYIPSIVPSNELSQICRNVLGQNPACDYPHGLFKCKNYGLKVLNGTIRYDMEVILLEPMLDYQGYGIQILPVPFERNKYSLMNFEAKHVFKNQKNEFLSFSNCEKRRLFTNCMLEDTRKVYGTSKCLTSLVHNDKETSLKYCKSSKFESNGCLYNKIGDTMFVSSFENITVQKIVEAESVDMSEINLGSRSGLFPIYETGVTFKCNDIQYMNQELPDVNIKIEPWIIHFDSPAILEHGNVTDIDPRVFYKGEKSQNALSMMNFILFLFYVIVICLVLLKIGAKLRFVIGRRKFLNEIKQIEPSV